LHPRTAPSFKFVKIEQNVDVHDDLVRTVVVAVASVLRPLEEKEEQLAGLCEPGNAT